MVTETFEETVPMRSDRADRKAGRLPLSVAKHAYEVYTYIYPGQTFARLHERGGFGVGEVIAFLYARQFPQQQWRVLVDGAFRGMVA